MASILSKKVNSEEVGQQEKLLALIDRFFIPLIILLAGTILGLGYVFFIDGQITRFSEAKNKRDKMVADIVASQASITSLQNQFSSRVKLTDNEKSLLNAALPDSVDYPSLIIQFTSMVVRSGMFPSAINIGDVNAASPFSNAAKTAGISQVGVQLSLGNCDYAALKRLSGLMESSLMISGISSVSLSPKSTDCSVNVVAYYYKK